MSLSGYARAQDENMGNAGASPASLDAPLARKLSTLAQSDIYCIWRMGHLGKPAFLNLLQFYLGHFIANVIRVVKATQNSDSQVRFDVFFDVKSLAIARRMCDLEREHNAHLRAHVPYGVRKSLARAAIVPSRALDNISIVTWNICWFASKREEISLFLNSMCPSILCLQETWRENVAKPVYLPGYKMIETPCMDGQGKCGLAIVFRACLNIVQLAWATSPYTLAAIMHVEGGVVVIVNVYISQRRGGVREEAKAQLGRVLKRVNKKYSEAIVIVCGDLNTNSVRTSRMCDEFGLGLVEVEGDNRTYHKHMRGVSDIDHILISRAHLAVCGSASVLNSYDTSDHWPLMASFNISAALASPLAGRPRLSKERMGEKEAEIRGSNYWAPLLEQMGDLDADVSAFVETSHALAAEVGAVQLGGATRKSTLSRATVRAIKEKQSAARNLATEGANAESMGAYSAAKRAAKTAINSERRAKWAAFVARGAALRVKNPKSYWRFLRQVGRFAPSIAMVGLPPVANSAGRVAASDAETLEAWSEYYKGLLEVPVNSDVDWAQAFSQLPQREQLDINGDISWGEVCWALSTTAGYKAPGASGIQTAWLQAAADAANAEGDYPPVPSSDMGKCVLSLVQRLWAGGRIPDSLSVALLVSIYKKGDSTDPSNYRGISLVDCLLKLVCTVVARRLSLAVEEQGWLSTAQAGFRRREEAMANAVALFEVVRRRQLSGKKTFVTFVDIKKAFDTVPTGALMAKLAKAGLSGRALEFIQALYANAAAAVRGPGGLMGLVFAVTRGVRQGCPLSPILFDIFINDIFDEIPAALVTVDLVTPGFLFADDGTVIAGSGSDMEVMLTVLGDWAARNGMEFNVPKCGATVVGADLSVLEDLHLSLAGEAVPIVSSYKYMGVMFSNDVPLLGAALEAKLQGANKLIHMAKACLGNKSIPLCAKLDLIRSVVLPTLAWGGELLGMNMGRARKLDSLLAKALVLVTKGWGKGGAAALRQELGIASVHATMSGMRARAFVKYPSLSSVVAKLMAINFVARCSTWVSGTSRWIARLGGECKEALGAEGITSTAAGRIVRREVERGMFESAARKAKGCASYLAADFGASKGFIKHFVSDASLLHINLGVTGLIACRTGALFTARKAASAGVIPARFRKECPCCGEARAESLRHLLLSCEAWDGERAELLTPLLELLPAGISRADQVTLLLGGGVGDFTLEPRWSKEVEGARPLYCLVALFLTKIHSRRGQYIWSHSTSPLSQSPLGMAALPGGG